MRGLQVVDVPSFQTHIAKQSWCGLPKNESNTNEWLIVNYMVRADSKLTNRNISKYWFDCLYYFIGTGFF